MNKSLLKSFFIVDIFIILACVFLNEYTWLLNIQIAFITSFIVSMATFYSYKNNIDKNVVGENEKYNEELDYIDKIDDPYDLYSDEVCEQINENPSPQEIKEAMKPIKQNHLANLKQSILAFSSFYRILAYAILIFGFFYLNNNNILHIYSYLLGFLIVPISSLFIRTQ